MIATMAEKKVFAETKRLYSDSILVMKNVAMMISFSSKDSLFSFSTIRPKFQAMFNAFYLFDIESYFTLKSKKDSDVQIVYFMMIKSFKPVTKTDIISFLSDKSKEISDAVDEFVTYVPEVETLLNELVIRANKILEEYQTAVNP